MLLSDALAHDAMIRPVGAQDWDALVDFGRDRSDAVLYGQDFSTFEAFLRDERDPVQRQIFLVAYDAGMQVRGWACCRRFHERPGYARTFRYFTDFTQAGLADRLFEACVAQARLMGADTFVGLLRSDMAWHSQWHKAKGFDEAGSVYLPGGLELTAFIQRIAA